MFFIWLNIFMMSVFPQLICWFSVIPIKIPASYFLEIDKFILKILAKTMLEKKNKVGGLRSPGFKTYYKGTVIKLMSFWHKDLPIDQWKRLWSLEIDPYVYRQLVFDKDAEINEKMLVFNKWCCSNSISIFKKWTSV